MSNAGIPLRIIQEISGQRNLDQLQRYLEVEHEQVKGVLASLSLCSPVNTDNGKDTVERGVETAFKGRGLRKGRFRQ